MGLFCACARRCQPANTCFASGEDSREARLGVQREIYLTFRLLFAYDCRAAKTAQLISFREATMTIGQSMLAEFDQEMQNTRKILERVPDEKWNWKPHDKSGSVGWLAVHVATIPEWAVMTLKTENFDYAPPGGSSYQPPKIENRQQLLTLFDKSVTETRASIG